MSISITKNGHCYCLQTDAEHSLPSDLFDPQWLQSQKMVESIKAAGRGEVVFFEYQGLHLVLRQYQRGGLAAKLSQTSYLWGGLKKSRAYKELALLDQLQSLELPISRAFAAQVCRNKASYQAALVTYQIKAASSLSELLQSAEQVHSIWAEIGRVIRQFHHHNVYHSDLNANNILLNKDNKVYLIDFDKCEIKQPNNTAWKAKNLQRLQRSLLKLQKKYQYFAYNQEAWDALLGGYNNEESSS